MRALIVDDESFIRAMMVEVLVSEGFDTDESFDGDDAIQKLAENTYDIVITDVVMPNASGLSVAEFIRANEIPAAILAISAHAGAEDSETNLLNLMKDYVDAMLEKPFDAATFMDTVRKLTSDK